MQALYWEVAQLVFLLMTVASQPSLQTHGTCMRKEQTGNLVKPRLGLVFFTLHFWRSKRCLMAPPSGHLVLIPLRLSRALVFRAGNGAQGNT